MKTILYANIELLTGDDIAAAVLRFSEALGTTGLAETIEIPVIEADGSRGTAMMLVGPASQIVVKDAETGGRELVDSHAVAELNGKARRLKHTATTGAAANDALHWPDDI
ncbi:MAG TPA: hypothetical protein VFY91_00675 [Microbacterium sp.]|nr:hypothetical protein [Microbacterium sp.]